MIRFDPVSSGSGGNCYLVSSGDHHLLVEAGIRSKLIKEALWRRGLDLCNIDGCLISHAHGDHACGVKDLLKNGVHCYMSHQTALALGVYDHHRTYILGPRAVAAFEGWGINTFEVRHDADQPGTLGFQIDAGGDRMVFISDALYSPFTFDRVGIFCVEANHDPEIAKANMGRHDLNPHVYSRTAQSHMSIETCIDLLRANDLSHCRQIYLLHLSAGNSNAEDFRRRVQEACGVPVSIAGVDNKERI